MRIDRRKLDELATPTYTATDRLPGGRQAVRYHPQQDGPLRSFEGSDKHKELISQYREGVTRLQSFLESSGSTRAEAASRNLATFADRVASGSTGRYAGLVDGLYNQGKEAFDALQVALSDERAPLDVRRRTVEMLADEVLVCSQGTLSNLMRAASTLMGATAGIAQHAGQVWNELADELLARHSAEQHGKTTRYLGNEIHYVNAYRERLREDFGLVHRPDEYARRDVRTAQVEAARQCLREGLTAERLVAALASRLRGELIDGLSHLASPADGELTLEQVAAVYRHYHDALEPTLRARYGAIDASLLFSSRETDDDVSYRLLLNESVLMHAVARNLGASGLLASERDPDQPGRRVVMQQTTPEGTRQIKRLTEDALYVKERTPGGEKLYRELRLSDLPYPAQAPLAVLHAALLSEADPAALDRLDPADIWAQIQGASSVQSLTLQHPAIVRYRSLSPRGARYLEDRVLETLKTEPRVVQEQTLERLLQEQDGALATRLAQVLARGGPPVHRDPDGRHLLHRAAKRGHEGVLRAFLPTNNHPPLATLQALQQPDALGNSPLMLAAGAGQHRIVDALVRLPFDPSERNADGRTALHLAAMAGEPLTMSILLQHLEPRRRSRLVRRPVAPIDTPVRGSRDTALTLAAAHGHRDVVRMLLALHANTAHANAAGETALHAAVRLRRGDLADLLLSVSPQAAATAGTRGERKTPLMLAADLDDAAMIERLAPHSHIDQRDDRGRTALIRAAGRGQHAALDALLRVGANPNKQDSTGLTPVMRAAMVGDTASVVRLHAAGADLNRRPDMYGPSALSLAIEQGHTSVVEALLSAGVRTDGTDVDRRTPLMLAARRGQVDIVRLLLQRIPAKSLLAQSVYHETALSLARNGGHLEVVRLLERRLAQLR